MKRTILAILLIQAPFAYCAEPPNAAQLRSEIAAKGPKSVLRRLWKEPASFDQLCSKIETGAAEWLEIAKSLRSVSDAAATESLNYSVARALPYNPEAILGLIGQGFSVSEVCTSPYNEPEPGAAAAYEKAALRALASVRSPKLLKVRDECAARVKLPGA